MLIWGEILGTDVPASIWTHAELCLGVVSACLPCFKPLLRGVKRMMSSVTNSTLSKQVASQSHSHSKPSTDPYKSLNGKETSINGSKIALVSTDDWKTNKARTEIKGGVMVEEDVESGMRVGVGMGVPRDAIGVTRDVDVSSMVAK